MAESVIKIFCGLSLCVYVSTLYCNEPLNSFDTQELSVAPDTKRYTPLVSSGVTTKQSIGPQQLNYSASANAGLFAITTSGYYYLADDLILSQTPSNTNPVIFINANNVVLDLGTKTIAGNGNANTVLAGIQIANGISNVTIKNGVINGISSATSNANGFGVLVNTSAASTVSHIILQDLSIFTCGLGVAVRKCNDLILSNIECTSNGPALNAAGSAFGYMGSLYLETVNGCRIENSTFSNSTWQFAGAGGAVHIVGAILSSCLDIEITDSHFDNNANDTSNTASGVYALGLYLLNTSNCTITNVTASNNTRSVAVGNSCIGVLVQGTSTGNVFTNCKSNNNTGTSSCFGFSIESASSTGSNGNVFVDCLSNLNKCTGTSGTAAAVAVYGFSIDASTSNQFTNCIANMNNIPSTASLTGATAITVSGFATTSSAHVTKFINCIANNNNLSSTATVPAGITANIYGFYNVNSNSNSCINCRAEFNAVPGDATNTTVRKAVGFFSNQGLSNQFYQCQANYNNISTTHGPGGARSSTAFAAGFQLGDTGGAGTTNVETASIIRECIANSNFTAGITTSAPVYGIVILPNNGGAGQTDSVSENNIIEWCKVTYNLSQNTATTGRSYGIADLTFGANSSGAAVTGSTTLMRYNFSVGHGSSLSGTNPNTPFTSFNMNYYLDYRLANVTSRLGNVIVENNISNLTAAAIHDINNYDILNVGLLNP